MQGLPDGEIDLVVTSPPYALHFKKEYGNADQKQYVAWFLPFAREIRRILRPEGSFVLNVGGAWTPGAPSVPSIISAYCSRFVTTWASTSAKSSSGTIRRRCLPRRMGVRASNPGQGFGRVHLLAVGVGFSQGGQRESPASLLQGHGAAHQAGHKADEATVRSQHQTDVLTRSGRAIPANIITCGNNESNSSYIKQSKKLGQNLPSARFPAELPRFFIEFLTDHDDLVLDPFAGSNTTGAVAEQLGRRVAGHREGRDLR